MTVVIVAYGFYDFSINLSTYKYDSNAIYSIYLFSIEYGLYTAIYH